LRSHVIRTSLPSTAQVSVLDQRSGRQLRRIVHVLHYPATRRAPGLDIIEDRGELHDVAIDLAAPSDVRAVETIPQREPIPFEQSGGRVRFIVPRITGHQGFCVTLRI
jgi:hypothetical protein